MNISIFFPIIISVISLVISSDTFIDIISKLLCYILKISELSSHLKKIIYKYRIVMKDNQKNLYTFILNDNKELMKIIYNLEKQTITSAALNKLTDSEHFKFASSDDSLVFNFIYESIKKKINKGSQHGQITKETSIIVNLLKKKFREFRTTYLILGITLFILIVTSFFFRDLHNSQSVYVMFFICIIFLLAFIKQHLLNYRVKKRLYGTCYSEAKEIISFMTDEKKQGGTGSGKTQLIFRPEEESGKTLLENLGWGEYGVQRN